MEILVSANLIDRIQVRDNGHGIQVDDYESLGRMCCTSKLTSFEELKAFDGNTLGFRGQALASMNSLGRVTVVTRCIEDPTAMKLTLCPGVGGIESQQRISASVGTTVAVEELFKTIPVREQVAEKEAHRNLAKAKHLLKAYALARPMIRLSFKILGGDSKQAWSYCPRPDASVREAVVQVFGAGVMSECVLRTVTTDTGSQTEHNACDGSRLTIEAVLPKPDADLSKLSKGTFFSVDARPVSTSRGTMKKLLADFKMSFKKSLGVDAEDRRLSDLFTCVNVRCSPGTYDPNVEPSKSEVLFADESRLAKLFEELCSKTYQSRQKVDAFVTIEKRPLTRRAQTRTPPPSSDGPQDNIELLVPHLDEPSHNTYVRQPGTPEVSSPNTVLLDSSDTNVIPSQHQGNRHRVPETRLVGYLRPHQSPTDSPGCQAVGEAFPRESMHMVELPVTATHPKNNTEELNNLGQNVVAQQPCSPWRSRESPTVRESASGQADPYYREGFKRRFIVNMSADPDLSSDEEAEICAPGSHDLQETTAPPEESCDTSKEALNPWVIARITAPARQTATSDTAADSIGRSNVHTEESHALPITVESFEEELPVLRPQRGAPRDLDTPRVMRFANTHMGHLPNDDARHPGPPASWGPKTTTRAAGLDQPQSPLPTEHSTGRRKLPDFRPHGNILDNIDLDGLVQTTLSFDKPREPRDNHKTQTQLCLDDVPTRRNPPFRKPKRVKKPDQGYVSQDACTGGEFAEYSVKPRNSNRTANVSTKDHGFEASHLPRFDHRNLEDSHVDHLPTVQQQDRGYTKTNDFDGDPRKYLIRRQRSEAAHRRKGRQSIKRTKTNNLPLEKVPSGDETKHLVLHLNQETIEACNASKRTPSFAAYREGTPFGALLSSDDVDDIQSRLQTVVTSWTERTFGEKGDIEMDLHKAVKGSQMAA